MKLLRHTTAILAIFPLLSAASTVSTNSVDMEKTLYIVTHHLPPYSSCEGKTVTKSFIKDIMAAACQEGALPCLLECFPNRRSKAMLRSGAAHGNYPLGWNVDRDQWLHWSPKLNASEYGFYQNNNTDYTDVESFIGKTVGVFGPSNTQRSLTTIKDKLYRKHKKTFHVSIQPNASGNNMRKLSFGRIDGVFISRDNGNIQLKNLGIDNVNYAFSVKRLNYYIGFSKEKNQGNRKRLIDRFNVSLNSLYKKGVIDKIIKEYGITPLDDSIR